MRHPVRSIAFSTAVLPAAFLVAIPMFGQAPTAATKPAPAKAAETKAWSAPKTADGQPDLQGIWSTVSNVPLEAPAQGRGGRGGAAGRAPARAAAQPEGALAVHYDNSQFGLDRSHVKVAEDDRKSLIFDPADGRIPQASALAQKRAADRAAFTREHQWDGPETRPLGERCILWPNEGPPMLSPGYNSNLQIVQGVGYVAIMQEMIHDTRIIPIDNRPHIPADIHQWMGDARGHWEGNTLVVDTTNFTDKTAFQRSGDKLHVVERFTRTSPDTLEYQFTVDDPDTWDRPWSAKVIWEKTDGPIYEYACQEGNYGMHNNLSSARAEEKKAAEKAAGK